MAASEKRSKLRTRNFATVVYPESAPENWKSILFDQCISSFISPLHDSDLDPDGELKKPHWHVMLMYEGPKTIEQAQSVIDIIGGVGCEVVQSQRGYARYLCHLDNPDKHQYSVDDVICVSGADYLSVIGLPTDRLKAISEMLRYCRENNIISYAILMDYAMEFRYDWFRVLCENGSYPVMSYLKSLSWMAEKSSGLDC